MQIKISFRNFSFVVCVLLFFNMTIALYSQTLVAIDASASMEGFFNSGEMAALVQKIKPALNDPQFYIRTYKCFDRNGDIDESEYSVVSLANGRWTFLNKCLQKAVKFRPKPTILFFITDNVQDPEGATEEQGDINRFYNEVRSKRVAWAHLFPLKLHFNGPLYRRNGSALLTDHYSDLRGLIVYTMLLDESRMTKYQEMLERLGRVLNFRGIEAKFSSDETVAVVPLSVGNAISARKKKSMLVLKDNTLVSASRTPFTEGEKIEGNFCIGFRSKLHYLTIDQASVNAKVVEDFSMVGSSDGVSDFTLSEKANVRCDPPVLRAPIIPGNREEGVLPHVNLSITFEKGVHFRKNLGSILRYAVKHKAGDFRGTVEVKLGVRSENLKLVDDVVRRYSISSAQYFDSVDPNVQSKILNLDKLYKATYDFSDLLVKKYPIHFMVNYPFWPTLVLLAFVVLILIGAYQLSRRSPKYRLNYGNQNQFSIERVLSAKPSKDTTDDVYAGLEQHTEVLSDVALADDQNIFSLLPFFQSHRIILDQKNAATIRSCPPFGLLVIAAKNYRVSGNRMLRISGSAGGQFEVKNVSDSMTELIDQNLTSDSSLDQLHSNKGTSTPIPTRDDQVPNNNPAPNSSWDQLRSNEGTSTPNSTKYDDMPNYD